MFNVIFYDDVLIHLIQYLLNPQVGEDSCILRNLYRKKKLALFKETVLPSRVKAKLLKIPCHELRDKTIIESHFQPY